VSVGEFPSRPRAVFLGHGLQIARLATEKGHAELPVKAGGERDTMCYHEVIRTVGTRTFHFECGRDAALRQLGNDPGELIRGVGVERTEIIGGYRRTFLWRLAPHTARCMSATSVGKRSIGAGAGRHKERSPGIGAGALMPRPGDIGGGGRSIGLQI